jgi:hypothetical protein
MPFTVCVTTETASEPDAVESLALTIVTPGATAVMNPLVDTVATPGFDDVHVAVAVTSDDAVADWCSLAVSCPVCPTTNVSPPVKEIEGANVVDGPGVTVVVVVEEAVVVGVVGELEHETASRARPAAASRVD